MTDMEPTTATLIDELRRRPTLLHELSYRQFEEVVAELLAGFGFKVSLTQATRDSGYDILAVLEAAPGIEAAYIVECKRYRPEHPIGVESLRSLYGLKEHLRFSGAVLVTTSRFSRGAERLSRDLRGIELVDFDLLVDWLGKYVPPPSKLLYLPSRRFFSCFISHSSKDQEFVDFLVGRLRGSGVKVWYSPDDMVPGPKLGEEIFKAINAFDKLLIVLSEASMNSEWVMTELRRARRREMLEGRRVLFPVSTVPFDRIRSWECFDADTGKDLAVELREYLVPDFSNWRRPECFENEFSRLLAGLQAEENAA
jgi:Restriction endonuclease/TIR domain